MPDHHSITFGDNHFNMPDFPSNNHGSQLSFENFQLPPVHFDTNLNLPSLNQPHTLIMPDLGASLNLHNHHGPVLFSTPNVNLHSNAPEHHTSSGIEAYLELSGPMASGFGNHGLGHGLEAISSVVIAAEAGHRLAHHATHDIHAGVPTGQALFCNTLGAFAQGGSQLFMNVVIGNGIVDGGVATLSTSVAGFAAGNPVLAAAGVAGTVAIANLAVPAFKASSEISQTVGDGVTAICHESFNQARMAARGGI
jgi:hypothetical protein